MPVTEKTKKLDAAREALRAIERVYLRAGGFVQVGEDLWIPPPDDRKYRYHEYRTGHAINALKLWDRRGN